MQIKRKAIALVNKLAKILTLLLSLLMFLCFAKTSFASSLADNYLLSQKEYDSYNWNEVSCIQSDIVYKGGKWEEQKWFNYAGEARTDKFTKSEGATIEFITPITDEIIIELSTRGAWTRSSSVLIYIDGNLIHDWNLKDTKSYRHDSGQKLAILRQGEIKKHNVKIVNNSSGEYLFFWGYSNRIVEKPTSNVILADLTVDNGFELYVSTSDVENGMLIKTGDEWRENYNVVIPLTPNVINYLNVKAVDLGDIAGFIGDFTIRDDNFTFANGSKYLVTDTYNWQVSKEGFGIKYEFPTTSRGPAGGAPEQVDKNARWIWTNNGWDVNTTRYFSIPIIPKEINSNQDIIRVGDNQLVGTWTGTYVANQGETALTLTVNKGQNGNMLALFEFGPLPNNTSVPIGSYTMIVTDLGENKYRLIGDQWVNHPSNYYFADLEGTIDQSTGVFRGNLIGKLPSHVFHLERKPSTLTKKNLLGTWSGTYDAPQGETKLDLEIKESNGQPHALFNFGPTSYNPGVPYGSFSMKVQFTSGYNLVKLTQEEWISRPSDYIMIDLLGQVDLEKGTYIGTIVGYDDYKFRLTRKGGIIKPQPSGAIKILINNVEQNFPQAPVMINGRVMVPLRSIFEALGAEVKWDAQTQTVKATKGSTTIELKIGDSTAYKNGQSVILDPPAQIVNGSTMVPVRFVSEALGCKVDWESASQTVIINTDYVSIEDALIGRWKGTWNSFEGESNATLTIEKSNVGLNGLFEFGPKDNDVPFGSCYMYVNYTPEGQLTLSGYEWLNKPSNTFNDPFFKGSINTHTKTIAGNLSGWSDKTINLQYQGNVTSPPVTRESINNISEIRSAVLVYSTVAPITTSNYKILTPNTEFNYTDTIYLSMLVNYTEEVSSGWNGSKTYVDKSVLVNFELDKTDWFTYSNEYQKYLINGININNYKPNLIRKVDYQVILSNLIPGDTVSLQGRFRYKFLKPGEYLAVNSTIKVKPIPFEVTDPPQNNTVEDLEKLLYDTLEFDLQTSRKALNWCFGTTKQLIELMPSLYGITSSQDLIKLVWNITKDQINLQQDIENGKFSIDDNWADVGKKTFQIIKTLKSLGK
ncbi:copper amine oxidase N-terminal domain-containing protein [Pelotomaculum propionicicum]|uniref:copper amine oxidase N-terminal domain-containing protein n=1 Tax=Pelotomaculum propionicicum TaxID=258475 RepID=UPI003B7DF7EA